MKLPLSRLSTCIDYIYVRCSIKIYNIMIRDVFRTQSNIYDGVFAKTVNSLAVNYYHKKAPW